MSCLTWISGRSWIHRTDPRARVISTGLLIAAVTASDGWRAAGVGGLLALALAGAARLPLRLLVRVLSRLNLLLAAMTLFVLPLLVGSFTVSFSDGWLLLGRMFWKGNAIVLIYLSLLATMEPLALGVAMQGVHVPSRLVLLYLLTVRYLDVLYHEWERIRRAIWARGFRPRLDRHTFHVYGNALGQLFLRSLDRSERIIWAMKCRGFRGRFPLPSEKGWSRGAVGFILGCGAVACLIVGLRIWR